jgi:di/tricarboxylate transporter
VALGILAAMVLAVSLNWLSMLVASMLAAGFMLIARCCSASAARRSVDWTVLIVIAAALGIGRAMDVTGAAGAVAHGLLRLAGENPLVTLAVMYFVTTLFTELLTNNAAAVLMFPIAMAVATRLDVNYMPFIITIMMAASASFSTPVGYQTNLMVYGPGGYRFADYARIGIALNVMVGVITVLLAPRIWPF